MAGAPEIQLRLRRARLDFEADEPSKVKDPICGMTVDTAAALRAEREGKIYYFCSEGCKRKFQAGTAIRRR